MADIPHAAESSQPTRRLIACSAGWSSLGGVPALLLWGPRDPIFSPAFLRDLEHRLPQADVHRFAGASHLVTEDEPEAAERAWSWIRTRSLWVDDAAAAERPARPCDRHRGRRWLRQQRSPSRAATAPALTTFTALSARIDALAGTLRGAGVRPGHRVALLVPPGLELTAAVYACWRVGAAIVVADTGLGWRRMAEALRSADPDHLVGVPAAIAAAAALRIPGGTDRCRRPARPIRRLRSHR